MNQILITKYPNVSTFNFVFKGLSLFWTKGLRRKISILDVKKYMSEMPAKLIGLHKKKGKIAENFDADFVIWDPNAVFTINESNILHKNKVFTRHLLSFIR